MSHSVGSSENRRSNSAVQAQDSLAAHSLNYQSESLSDKTVPNSGTVSAFSDNFLSMPSVFKSLAPTLLGQPGSDNAVYMRVDSGKSIFRALFDCGAGCLNNLSMGEISKIDTIFLSHLHFDHIAGFDHFLRFNFDRGGEPVRMYGPPKTAEIIHHKLQGFLWDRVAGSTGEFLVTEIHGKNSITYSMTSNDGFKAIRNIGQTECDGTILKNAELRVDAITLDHGSPSIGYLLKTNPTQSLDSEKLRELGLPPGPWIKQIKDPQADENLSLRVGEQESTIGDLRKKLLSEKPGESFGYLTDFRLTSDACEDISRTFLKCDLLVCENNYRNSDRHLAAKNYHATSSEVAELANASQVKNLILFHLSDRYSPTQWLEQINDVRQAFPSTYFANEWREIFAKSA